MRSGQDGCAATLAAAASAERRSRDLAPEPGPASARVCKRWAIRCKACDVTTAAMFARAVTVALLSIMAAAGPAQAQACADAPTRACVRELALAAAHAIQDEGARAQALGQMAVVSVGADRIDDGIRLAQSITD